MKKLVTFLVLLVVAGGLVVVGPGALPLEDKPVVYRTQRARRGDVHATISATGTIEPEEVVDVGAQVPGMILSLGRDLDAPTRSVDNCSRVEEGSLLAQIDDKLFRARLAQAVANLAQAIANVDSTKARVRQCERELARAQQLHGSRSAADADVELAHANYDNVKASLDVALANVETCRAALLEADANLGYTKIRSPVRGVIIDRRVNVGQTVVASLNAPSLFLIAKDLRRMVIWASVNEADIGQVKRGQNVRFTVAAYPDDELHGRVTQIRLNASMSQSVVTYTVEVAFDNTDGKLLPYMTASLQFEVAQRSGVLYLPNAALRWRPAPALVAPEHRAENTGPKSDLDGKETVTVWLKDGQGHVRPREIHIGLTDGINTEVKSGLAEGDDVVTGVERQGQSTRNIFDLTKKLKQSGH